MLIYLQQPDIVPFRIKCYSATSQKKTKKKMLKIIHDYRDNLKMQTYDIWHKIDCTWSFCSKETLNMKSISQSDGFTLISGFSFCCLWLLPRNKFIISRSLLLFILDFANTVLNTRKMTTRYFNNAIIYCNFFGSAQSMIFFDLENNRSISHASPRASSV
jgi:hypothetical protein